MAIADAVTLARLIISGERNLVPAYESIRRKPNERGLRPTRFAARMFGALQNPILRSLPGLLFPGILGLPGLVPKLLRTLAYGSANPDAATSALCGTRARLRAMMGV